MAKVPRKPPSTKPPIPMEHDEGFNESHGYGPGHGGPTSPGDAPAKQPAQVVPCDDPVEKEEP